MRSGSPLMRRHAIMQPKKAAIDASVVIGLNVQKLALKLRRKKF